MWTVRRQLVSKASNEVRNEVRADEDHGTNATKLDTARRSRSLYEPCIVTCQLHSQKTTKLKKHGKSTPEEHAFAPPSASIAALRASLHSPPPCPPLLFTPSARRVGVHEYGKRHSSNEYIHTTSFRPLLIPPRAGSRWEFQKSVHTLERQGQDLCN